MSQVLKWPEGIKACRKETEGQSLLEGPRWKGGGAHLTKFTRLGGKREFIPTHNRLMSTSSFGSEWKVLQMAFKELNVTADSLPR